MKKIKLFSLALLALFSMSMWGTEVTLSAESSNPKAAAYFAPDGTAISAIAGTGGHSFSYDKGSKITVQGKTDKKVATITFTIANDVTITSFTVNGTKNNNTQYDLDGTNVTFGTALTGLSKTSSMVFRLTCTDGTSSSSNRNTVITSIVLTYTSGEDTDAPTLASSTPANNASDVAVSGNIVLTFSEDVTINDASKFTISPDAGVTLSTPTVNGAVVTIPYSGLVNLTQYTFSTAAEAVKDGSNNKNAALDNIIFTTACEAPASALVLSSDAATDVYVGDVITFSTTGGNGGAITIEGSDSEEITDGKWTATLGEHTFTASQAINGGKCAQESELSFNVLPSPICPSGLTITGTQAYTEFEDIELTASLSAGNGSITYNWYKGADLATAKAAGSIGTGTTYSKASCSTSDAGNYFCVASKEDCDDAESAAYAVTVEELSYCYTFTPKEVEERDTLKANAEAATSVGGKMVVVEGSTIVYTSDGLAFEKTSNSKVNVTLNKNMKEGTVITAVLWSNNTGSARTLLLCNSSGTTKGTWSFTPSSASGEEKRFTYIVKEGDGLAGTNTFQLKRSSNVFLRSLKVGNCGADVPTDVENVSEEAAAVKRIVNGQLVIEKNGHVYNVLGGCVK